MKYSISSKKALSKSFYLYCKNQNLVCKLSLAGSKHGYPSNNKHAEHNGRREKKKKPKHETINDLIYDDFGLVY